MSRRRNKKIAPIWGGAAAFGLFWVMCGSAWTNIFPLNSVFPYPINIGLAISITIGFTMTWFLEHKKIGTKFTVTLILIISSVLGINAMRGKEIVGLEERLKKDSDYNDLITRAKKLDTEYDETVKQINNYMALQISGQGNWERGCRAARERAGNLLSLKTETWLKVEKRKNELNSKGTIRNESFVSSINTLMPKFSGESISAGAHLLLSLTCDTLIPIFVLVIISWYPNFVIPMPKRQKSWLKKFGTWFGKVSWQVRRLFDKSSEKFGREAEILSASSFRGREVVRRTNQIRDAYPDLTLDQIGAIVGKLVRDKPYKKNYISEILNEKYGRG